MLQTIPAIQRRGDLVGRVPAAAVAQLGQNDRIPFTRHLALEATERLGVLVAGVDLLPAPDGGWYVLEVNAVPGWRTLSEVTGIDVAQAIVQFLGHSSKR
jgi:ribosomal protein S6--L-glutamate ligase